MARIPYYARRLLKPLRLIEDIERWVAYRTYEKYHVVRVSDEPGYSDIPGFYVEMNFRQLERFVEIECAAIEAYSNKSELVWYHRLEYYLPVFLGRILIPTLKSPKLGLKHIQYRIRQHSNPKKQEYFTGPQKKKWDDYHLNFWKEVKDLYTWYQARKVRKDEDDVVGLSKFYEKIRKKYGYVHKFEKINDDPKGCSTMKFAGTEKEEKEYRRLLKLTWQEEERRHKEDETQLCRLAKIYRGLWT